MGDALAAAADAGVVFGSKAFNSLTEGECSYFFGSDAYIAAKSTHTAAVADESATAAAKQSITTRLLGLLPRRVRLHARAPTPRPCTCSASSTRPPPPTAPSLSPPVPQGP